MPAGLADAMTVAEVGIADIVVGVMDAEVAAG